MNKVKRVKRQKLNIKALIILLLIIYLIGTFLYALFTKRITNIYIIGTTLLTDNEIIEVADLKDYPMLIKISKKKLISKISTLELVENVEIEKKLNGKLIITITEAKPLFYNRNTSKVVLSNNKEVENNAKYLGIPTLINYVPNDLLQDFIKAFKEIDSNIISMINEIEYDPDISENITIDEQRFLLRMNDTNQVYVNVINMARLNDYPSIFATLKEERGTVYLDSYSTDNTLFVEYTNEVGDSSNDADED